MDKYTLNNTKNKLYKRQKGFLQTPKAIFKLF